MDKITLEMAIENQAWQFVYAGEPKRKIEVEMNYEDLKRITDLIGRDTPKKPIKLAGLENYDEFECPNCRRSYFIKLFQSRCLDCGQELDWSDEI